MIMNECKNQSTNNSGYIQVFNQGDFMACFIILYNLNGRQFETYSPMFSSSQTSMINIPDNADEVTVIMKVSSPCQPWTIAYSALFADVPQKHFQLSGNALNITCTEIQSSTVNNGNGNSSTTCCCCN